MAFLLWILAVILVVSGIVSLIRGQMLWGIVLIIVGLAGRPGRSQPVHEASTARREEPVPEGPALRCSGHVGLSTSVVHAVGNDREPVPKDRLSALDEGVVRHQGLEPRTR